MDLGMWVTELRMWVTGYELSTRDVGDRLEWTFKVAMLPIRPIMS